MATSNAFMVTAYKAPCSFATSSFVVTNNKRFCSLAGMKTFQQRLAIAIRRAGGQSSLVRKIKQRYAIEITPQAIQYLARETSEKPAKGSKLTAQIAGIAGLRAEWLASGDGEMDEPTQPITGLHVKDVHTELERLGVTVKETGEQLDMELTQEAVEVAKLFMDLNKKERTKFYRALVAEHRNHVDEIPRAQAPTTMTIARKRRDGEK